MKESQLDNKTAIATNDYVRMVDENGNSVKIKKDSFMAAIRDALPSIISDGATDGGSVLSIIGGALKSRTDANLASVLGVKDIGNGLYLISNTLVIGTYNGHYAHTNKISVAEEIISVLNSKESVIDQAVFIIEYNFNGRMLLRGFYYGATNYAFVEGKDAWGANWSIRKKNGGEWIDF